jgi:hypothetical protein
VYFSIGSGTGSNFSTFKSFNLFSNASNNNIYASLGSSVLLYNGYTRGNIKRIHKLSQMSTNHNYYLYDSNRIALGSLINRDYSTNGDAYTSLQLYNNNSIVSETYFDWVFVRSIPAIEPTFTYEKCGYYNNIYSLVDPNSSPIVNPPVEQPVFYEIKFSNNLFTVYPDFPNWASYNIVNHSGNGHQASITIPWKSGMKTDFSDIRFHDQNENKLYYYIVSYTSGVSANVLIKLTSFKKLYLRWGNGSAKSESNASLVGFIFDDFTETTLNPNWTVDLASGNHYAISDSTCIFNFAKHSYAHIERTGLPNEFVAECKIKRTIAIDDYSWSPGIHIWFNNTNICMFHMGANNGHLFINENVVSTPGVTNKEVAYNTSLNTYYYMKLVLTSSTFSCYYSSNYIDWTLVHSISRPSSLIIDSNSKIIIGSGYGTGSSPYANPDLDNSYSSPGGAVDAVYDWVMIKKYNAVESIFVYESSGYQPVSMYGNLSNERELINVYFIDSSDLYVSCDKKFENNINVSFLYNTNSDLPAVIGVTNFNDIYSSIDFNAYFRYQNDIEEYYTIKNKNDINLSKLLNTSNNIREYLNVKNKNDINSSKLLKAVSDIFLFLASYHSSPNDIKLSIFPCNPNILKLDYMIKSINSIWVNRVSTDYRSISDINMNAVKENVNNIRDDIYIENVNNLASLTRLFRSFGDINLTTYIYDNYDSLPVFNYINTNDTFIENSYRDQSDIKVAETVQYEHDGNTYIVTLIEFNLIALSETIIYPQKVNNNNVNVILPYIVSNNNVNGGFRFRSLNDMYLSATKRYLSSINLSTTFVGNSDLPSLVFIENLNNIEGRIRGNKKEYVYNKITVPYIEEKKSERVNPFAVYPYSNIFFTFSNKEICIFNNIVNKLFTNIPDCKGIAWFNDHGVEFYAFDRPMEIRDINVYLDYYNRILVELKPDTRIFHGYISYMNKVNDIDEYQAYIAIKDIIILMRRVGIVDNL